MIEKKLIDNLIDEIKEKYWCKTQATNNEYDELNISPKSNLTDTTANFTLDLDFSYLNSIYLNINVSNFNFSAIKSNDDLPKLHNFIDLLMKVEKYISDQQEINNARKDTNNARK